MTVDQVTVLNTDGTSWPPAAMRSSASPAQDGEPREDASARSCRTTSARRWRPISGLDNFEISVAARLNTDKRQINETNFNPEGKRVERSVRVVKETGSSQNSNASKAAVGVEQNVPADQAATAGRRRPVQEAATSAARS